MISENELRIGNWIIGELGNEMTVCSLFKNTIECDFNGGWCSVFCPKPIPLTPEILEKCGFERHKCGISGADMWQGMDGWSLKGSSNWLFRGNPKYGLKLVGYINSDIQYLHHLQNLHYALTGEELNYKP